MTTKKSKLSTLKDALDDDRRVLAGLQRVGVLSSDPAPQRKPRGSSPALRIDCPQCPAKAGEYCIKWGTTPGGTVQVIAHKRRREAAMFAAARKAGEAEAAKIAARPTCRCAGPLYDPDTPCPVHPRKMTVC